eukprot:1366454-Amorphochlora_amoeboformis.AAC.1
MEIIATVLYQPEHKAIHTEVKTGSGTKVGMTCLRLDSRSALYRNLLPPPKHGLGLNKSNQHVVCARFLRFIAGRSVLSLGEGQPRLSSEAVGLSAGHVSIGILT